MMTTINACTSAVLVWIWFWFVCSFFFLNSHFVPKEKFWFGKKSHCLEVCLFGLFCNGYMILLFFSSYFHWCIFRNYRAENNVLYLFIPFLFFFFFCCCCFWTSCFFSKAVSFAGLRMVQKRGGRAVTVSDLKEVLKAKTEEEGQTQRRRGEILSWGELLLLGMSCQTTVSRQHKQKPFKKKKKQLCPRVIFSFSYSSIPGGVFIRLLRERKSERERATVMLWPFEAITAAKMGKKKHA